MREIITDVEHRPDRAEASIDVAIAQMLALARRARFQFEVRGDRLLIRSAGADWKLWPPVRHYLDEIGVDAIVAFFHRTTPEERASLFAPAPGLH